jgi:antitoxin component of RelBE/YafQ-DinJ toxin-antitoxin module
MTRPKRRKAMGKTMIIIDDDTKKLWTKAAKKKGLSNSEYIRLILKECVPIDLGEES